MTSTLRLRARPLVAIALLAAGALIALGLSAARGVTASATGPDVAHFELVANPKFVSCLARFPGDPVRVPRADVTVQRGNLNDTLTLRIRNIKPHLAFDLFTVQNSQLRADGKI